MSATADKLVERYLKHLDVELDDLPRDRRHEIVDEISGHIAEARADLEEETESDVRNILDDLGDPAEIATDARDRFDVSPDPKPRKSDPGWVEIGALVMLLVGGLVLPVFGWVIGVVLLWVSNAWNTRDKIIGTIFVPGGLGLPVLLGIFAASSGLQSCGQSGYVGSEPAMNTCTDQGFPTTEALGIAGLIVLLLIPIVTTAYLAKRMRKASAAAIA
jgi:hypothetical protein